MDRRTNNPALIASYKWDPVTWVGSVWAPYYNKEQVTTHGLHVPRAQPSGFSMVFVLTRPDGGSTQAFVLSMHSLRSGAHSSIFALFSLRLNYFRRSTFQRVVDQARGVAPSPQHQGPPIIEGVMESSTPEAPTRG
jgi:hypothetical protein